MWFSHDFVNQWAVVTFSESTTESRFDFVYSCVCWWVRNSFVQKVS